VPLTPATLTIESSSTAADKVRADLLAVPVFADRRLGTGAEDVAAALGGDLSELMEEADFNGKRGETLAVPTGRSAPGRHPRRCRWPGAFDSRDPRGRRAREGTKVAGVRDHVARSRARVARHRAARKRWPKVCTSARTSSPPAGGALASSWRVVVLGRTNVKKAGAAGSRRHGRAWARDPSASKLGRSHRRGGERLRSRAFRVEGQVLAEAARPSAWVV
jgi:hypothetical protein